MTDGNYHEVCEASTYYRHFLSNLALLAAQSLPGWEITLRNKSWRLCPLQQQSVRLASISLSLETQKNSHCGLRHLKLQLFSTNQPVFPSPLHPFCLAKSMPWPKSLLSDRKMLHPIDVLGALCVISLVATMFLDYPIWYKMLQDRPSSLFQAVAHIILCILCMHLVTVAK